MCDRTPPRFDDLDVIRSRQDLEAHYSTRRSEDALVRIRYTMVRGIWYFQNGLMIETELGALLRGLEVLLEALGEADTENMIGGFNLSATAFNRLLVRMAEATAGAEGEGGPVEALEGEDDTVLPAEGWGTLEVDAPPDDDGDEN